MEGKDVIRVEGLTKYYGDLCAVDHIDFDLRKGEILGLLGPMGATMSGSSVKDVYSSDAYGLHQRNNPIYKGGGSERVIRGGSWGSIPLDVRCTNRSSYPTDSRFYDFGFRVVRTN
jgi:hypothetical protein